MTDLEELIQHHLAYEIDRGTTIRNVTAWTTATRQQLLDNERQFPGYIQRSINALHAKRDGKRITYCREERGTHGVSYVYDPAGTDEPAAWWNRDAAKHEEERRA